MVGGVTGALLHLQEASRLMSRGKSGSIINLSSIIGRVGFPGQTVYGASKAAIIGMTLAAAKELAAKNIRVNAVAPGFIDTDLTRALEPAKRNAVIHSIGMGRAGMADEVAGGILFLASDLASYVTGQILALTAGWSCKHVRSRKPGRKPRAGRDLCVHRTFLEDLHG